MTRLYIETNVYINFFKWESDRWRPLGEWALALLNRVLDGEFELVISDHLLDELKKHIDPKVVDDFIQKFKDKEVVVIEINATPEDIARAKAISPHYQDPLHAILANKAGANYLVTRDKTGFPHPCPTLVIIIVPESIP